MKANLKLDKNQKIKNQYVLQNKYKSSIFNQSEVTNEISDTCKDAKIITSESFQLCRKKATEILMFLMSNIDREKVNEGIDHIPIAYAMNGNSLKTEMMRK